MVSYTPGNNGAIGPFRTGGLSWLGAGRLESGSAIGAIPLVGAGEYWPCGPCRALPATPIEPVPLLAVRLPLPMSLPELTTTPAPSTETWGVPFMTSAGSWSVESTQRAHGAVAPGVAPAAASAFTSFEVRPRMLAKAYDGLSGGVITWMAVSPTWQPWAPGAGTGAGG